MRIRPGPVGLALGIREGADCEYKESGQAKKTQFDGVAHERPFCVGDTAGAIAGERGDPLQDTLVAATVARLVLPAQHGHGVLEQALWSTAVRPGPGSLKCPGVRGLQWPPSRPAPRARRSAPPRQKPAGPAPRGSQRSARPWQQPLAGSVQTRCGGEPTPTAHDWALTRGLVAAGKILGVAVCEHLIVASAERRISLHRQDPW